MIQDNSMVVTVDYGRTLRQMIDQCHFGWVGEEITDDGNFPISGEGVVCLEMVLVAPEPQSTSDAIVESMRQMGLRPATLAELLAFVAQFPDLLKERCIVALGSIWWMLGVNPEVPEVDFDGPEDRHMLCIDACGSDGRWQESDHFLAIRTTD